MSAPPVTEAEAPPPVSAACGIETGPGEHFVIAERAFLWLFTEPATPRAAAAQPILKHDSGKRLGP
jgi:hypothetical protein